MGLLDRIKGLGTKARAEKQGQGLESKFLLFQQQAIQFLRNCRAELVKNNRKGVQVWSEKFYRNYHDFTGLKDTYQAQGREVYTIYTDMINALGPIYEGINFYVNGQEVTVENLIKLIDNNSRFVAGLKIVKRAAA
ncbi:hypothetical protein HZC31_04845 [Candidatus Woesearchaeota archaeon]|nr:hypothetical protein [Candidatus Woesearchaeota archaeon]